MTYTEIRDKLRERIGSTIFSVYFIKKDGAPRLMLARLGVKKGVKGSGQPWNPLERGYLTVFDMNKKEHRLVNLNTVQWIKIRGEVFDVRRQEA